jgi:hypothetical protein
MAFKKGQSGNPAGRPKGSKTKEIKDVFGMIKKNLNQVEKEMQNASPEQRKDFLLKVVGAISGNTPQRYSHSPQGV